MECEGVPSPTRSPRTDGRGYVFAAGEEEEEEEDGDENEQQQQQRVFPPMWPFGVHPGGRLPIPECAERHKDPSKSYVSAAQRRFRQLRNPNLTDSPGYELPDSVAIPSQSFGEPGRDRMYDPPTLGDFGLERERRGFQMLPNPVRHDIPDVISWSNHGIACGRK